MDNPQAFFRRLVASVVCSAAGCSFLLRPPDTGNSNDGWRRSGIVLVRLCLVALPPLADASVARLRFQAAIRSITGGGTLSARGLMATPFILASRSTAAARKSITALSAPRAALHACSNGRRP